ncbi:MAG: DUF1203 domain-containing protein [Acidobacteriaceae bacterium]
MKNYRVIAIPTKVANLVRTTEKAPGYGHPAHTEIASGHGPCRHCLKTFDIGNEHRTLFTYDPFHGIEEIPLPGPIFIHADGCSRYPEDGGYPQDMLSHSAVLNAYGKGQNLVARIIVAANDGHENAVEELLRAEGVDYIEVRDREAGCFDFHIEPNLTSHRR